MDRDPIDLLWQRAARGELTPADQRRLAALARPRSRWRPATLLALLAATGLLLADDPGNPAPGEPFVVVNGHQLTYDDFYTMLQDEHGLDGAQRLILAELVKQAAGKAKLAPPAAEVDERIRQVIIQRFGGNAARFSAWVAENGHTEASLRRQVAVEMMDLKLRSQGVEVTEAKLKAYFEQHQAQRYNLPDVVKYRQIVLADKARAEALLKQLQSGEESFFTAASTHSLDPAALETGGLVGPRSLAAVDQTAPAVGEALRALEPNQLAPAPVDVEGKWLLLLLLERQAGAPVKFEDVAKQVEFDYLVEHAVPENEFYGQLVKSASVAGLPRRYAVLGLQFGQPEAANPEVGPPAP